jgi:hypothetical protein
MRHAISRQTGTPANRHLLAELYAVLALEASSADSGL